MIYYNNNNKIVRSMEESDIDVLFQSFQKQGWQKPLEQFERYYKQQQENAIFVLVAEVEHAVAGYLLVCKAAAGPFVKDNLDEIVDFNVFIPLQKQGMGTLLMDSAEKLIAKNSDTATLAVGLHSGYGSAQRMYSKRGYVPDGSGVWYRDKPLEQYAPCTNDDSLVLYLSKQI